MEKGKDYGCKKINGIKCEVSNCIFHTKDQSCDAGEIQVGPGGAQSADETICVTFQPK